MHWGTLVCATLVVFSASSLGDPPACRLNEVMACNVTTLADEDGDFPDWIELYNLQEGAVSLLGYGLSDDPGDCFKWVFPDTVVPSGAFILVFASGKNRRTPGCHLHANFQVRANGERISLVDPSGMAQDTLLSAALTADISQGRIPDGGTTWFLLEAPTPGASNGSQPPTLRTLPPEIDPASGYYEAGIEVCISCPDEEATIYYTKDGSAPSNSSSVYSGPIQLQQTTVIRAVGMAPGLLPSLPLSRSYMVGFETELPVASIIAEPEDLWSEESGIYVEGPNAEPDPPHSGANYWQDWEIPVEVDFFESDRTIAFSQRLGMKIHGGWSRIFPQKSFRLTARDEYGPDRISYQLFPNQPLFSFKSVILRNSGQDWNRTMIRDALMTGVGEKAGLGVQAYRPTVVFLNGAYWGIHNMRERMDAHYLEAHYGVHRDSVDLIENHAPASAGDRIAYDRLMSLAEEGDLSQPEWYDSMRAMIDMDDFIRYMATELYIANGDWPWHNVRGWRPRTGDGRFRWLLCDTDCAFGLWQSEYDENTLARILDPNNDPWEGARGPAVLFRALLQNEEFREAFAVRFCDIMNLFFDGDTVLERIDDMAQRIEGEMMRQCARWYPDLGWHQKLESLREFACKREQYALQYLQQEFGVAPVTELTLQQSTPNGGRVFVNGFPIDEYPWRGEYAVGLPIHLKAEPFDGYEFNEWKGAVTAPSDSVLLLMPGTNATVCACFCRVDHARDTVLITEINYHGPSGRDPGDWIELSVCEGEIDLCGWIIRDEDNAHGYVIPENTTLTSSRCVVVAADPGAFEEVYPGVLHLPGELGFNLGNDGDQIRVFTPHGMLADSVAYDDRSPWPVQADGTGPTLQLIDARYPNDTASSWQASVTLLGDPGFFDVRAGGGADKPDEIPSSHRITGISPNPFGMEASLAIALAHPSRLCVKAYDSAGRLVRILADGYFSSGPQRIPFLREKLASGTYFLLVRFEDEPERVCPVVLLR